MIPDPSASLWKKEDEKEREGVGSRVETTIVEREVEHRYRRVKK